MTTDNLAEKRKLVYASKFLSRAALLLSDQPYPFGDKKIVLEQMKGFIDEAINGAEFLGRQDGGLRRSHSHLSSLEPTNSSLKMLRSNLNLSGISKYDIEYEKLIEPLTNIQSVVESIAQNFEISSDQREEASSYFSGLSRTYTSKSNSLLNRKVDRRQSKGLLMQA